MEKFKRDRVNRQLGAIILSTTQLKGNAKPGDVVTLQNVNERDIFYEGPGTRPEQNIRDPNRMPNLTGDAVFDAGFGRGWADDGPFVAENVCDAGEH